jgi:hypothetical protein
MAKSKRKMDCTNINWENLHKAIICSIQMAKKEFLFGDPKLSWDCKYIEWLNSLIDIHFINNFQETNLHKISYYFSKFGHFIFENMAILEGGLHVKQYFFC